MTYVGLWGAAVALSVAALLAGYGNGEPGTTAYAPQPRAIVVGPLSRGVEYLAPPPTIQPTATPTAPPAPNLLSTAYWFPYAPGYFAEVILCESGGDPNADTNPPYIGLLQVDQYLHAGKTQQCAAQLGLPASLYVPEVNLCVASIISAQGSQTGAWPNCP